MLHFRENDDLNRPTPTNDKNSRAMDDFDAAPRKKARSERQVEASRRNGKRSHGPRNTEQTKYNALRHGLRAQGLTAADDLDEYELTISALMGKHNTGDPLDRFVIQQTALEMVRMRRMDRLEAHNITQMSTPSDVTDDLTDDSPAIHYAMVKEYAGPVLDTLSRYKTSSMHRFLHFRRELERIPRDEPSPESTKDIADDDVIVADV